MKNYNQLMYRSHRQRRRNIDQTSDLNTKPQSTKSKHHNRFYAIGGATAATKHRRHLDAIGGATTSTKHCRRVGCNQTPPPLRRHRRSNGARTKRSIFIVFFVLSVTDFCEGNRRIPKKASYDNGLAHENTGDQVSVLSWKGLKQITEAIEYFKLNLPELTNYNTNSDVAMVRRALVKEDTTSRPNGRILKPKYRRRKRRRRRRRRRPRQPWSSPAPIPSPGSAPSPILTPDMTPPPSLTPKVAPPPLAPNPRRGTTPTLTPKKSPSLAPSYEEGPPSLAPTYEEGPSSSLAPSSRGTPNRPGAPPQAPNGPPYITPTPAGGARSPTPSWYGSLPSTPPPNPSLKPGRFPKPSPKPSLDIDPYAQEKTEKPLDSPYKGNGKDNGNGNGKERKLLIIAISSSVVAALAILSLFLICFFRLKKRRKPNDESREGGLFAIGNYSLLHTYSYLVSIINLLLRFKPVKNLKFYFSGSSVRSKNVGGPRDVMHNLSNKGVTMPGDQASEDGSLPFPTERAVPPSSQPPPPPPPPPPPSPPPPPPPSPPPPPPPLLPLAPPPLPPPPPPPQKAANVPSPPVVKPPPLGALQRSGNEDNESGDVDANKTKLKPFFWDKVNTSPNRSMVWHDIKAGSFQFNEEMMENLFGYGTSGQNKNESEKPAQNLQTHPKMIQIIEPKKAQNLAILLKALNITMEEVSDAIMEGNELPVEFISTLLKMAPTREEELKLRSYNGDLALLGPSERFLKVLVDIPFAFKRLEALLFIASLHEESSSVKDSFSILEVACVTLRNSRLFLKLLEAVLKTGNRMNVGTYRGGAQAFKLDTLLKLSDVKGTDGKTTLLSFVVQEMIRSEGNKAARRAKRSSEDVLKQPSKEATERCGGQGLEVVSMLSQELGDVKKAALIDGETLTSTVLKLGNMLRKNKDFLNHEMNTLEEDSQFQKFLAEFIARAEAEILWLLEEEKRVMALVKNTGDYFHGKSRKDEGLHLFVVVRDFLLLLDNVCNDIRRTTTMQAKRNTSNSTEEESFGRNKLFPSNKGSQSGYSSSDEDNQDSCDSP
ncbi:hypothetical protein SSX86_002153 [Deinandra increscens subsp. villosa]|uniref:Formin-like protein n=1 Tax=Deinandra increscens subsp. villosa TaxID=3103831 RepID=A0AAP0DNN2_9ASTR